MVLVMPMYDYKCSECGNVQEAFNLIAERHVTPACYVCGSETRLKITPPMVAPIMGGSEFPGYQCPVTDEFVTSRKRRKEIMQEHNLVEKG